jgi:preprotein translocase subunit YajC
LRRKECKKMIEALQKADEIINTVWFLYEWF